VIEAKKPGTEVSLRKSSGGVFEVAVDGVVKYSKRATGRFPTDAELLAAVA
jgi:selT/selW/selH-like putative selenoprotein